MIPPVKSLTAAVCQIKEKWCCQRAIVEVSFRWNRSRYSDMRTHCWRPSVLVVILFLARRIAGSATVYVVTGACCSFNTGNAFYDGVYEEKREPELHYKKLGEADRDGDYVFLYTDSRRPQTWILGRHSQSWEPLWPRAFFSVTGCWPKWLSRTRSPQNGGFCGSVAFWGAKTSNRAFCSVIPHLALQSATQS